MKPLKITLLVLACCILFQCEKKEESSQTTYQIVNKLESKPWQGYFDGTLWEVKINLYNEGVFIEQDSIDPIPPGGGESAIIEIPPECTRLLMSFKFLPRESAYYNDPQNKRQYLASYTYLEKGKNNVITIEASTLIRDNEKSALNEKSSLNDKINYCKL